MSCFECKHYINGTPDTYWEQGEASECTHDKSWICQFNAYFPFENGCKNFNTRRLINSTTTKQKTKKRNDF